MKQLVRVSFLSLLLIFSINNACHRKESGKIIRRSRNSKTRHRKKSQQIKPHVPQKKITLQFGEFKQENLQLDSFIVHHEWQIHDEDQNQYFLRKSGSLKNLLDDCHITIQDSIIIPLPMNITDFKKIIFPLLQINTKKRRGEDKVVRVMNNLSTQKLCDVVNALDYLDISDLLNRGCDILANRLKRKKEIEEFICKEFSNLFNCDVACLIAQRLRVKEFLKERIEEFVKQQPSVNKDAILKMIKNLELKYLLFAEIIRKNENENGICWYLHSRPHMIKMLTEIDPRIKKILLFKCRQKLTYKKILMEGKGCHICLD